MAGDRSSLSTFLKTCSASGAARNGHTHTRIKSSKTPGGCFLIAPGRMTDFYECYATELHSGIEHHMTEKQQAEDAPLLVDLDMRFADNVKERQHTHGHVVDCVMLYAESILEFCDVPEGTEFSVYVMEKPNVNVQSGVTKDGVHLVFGLRLPRGVQLALREAMIPRLADAWDDLPLTNSWEDVIDIAVAKGGTNWQLYGSNKPGHKPYSITSIMSLTYEKGLWECDDRQIGDHTTPMMSLAKAIPAGDDVSRLQVVSAQNRDTPLLQAKAGLNLPSVRARRRLVSSTATSASTDPYEYLYLLGAGKAPPLDGEKLDAMIAALHSNTDVLDHKIRETHKYAMALPAAYHGPGSYSKWIAAGWALANTSKFLFFTWIKLSSKSPCRATLSDGHGNFDWDNVPDLYAKWASFDRNRADGLSHRSIMYWVKEANLEEFKRIRAETIDYFIELTAKPTPCDNSGQLSSGAGGDVLEFDLAQVLYHICKDVFVCASIRRDIWYEYENGRWKETDSGSALRIQISKQMHSEYVMRIQETLKDLSQYETSDDRYDKLRGKGQKLASLAMVLKKTTWKNNIMREAKELFYDKHFLERLDQNPYLLCFSNGVVDFTQKRFRPGQPDDYLSKCTNIEYKPYSSYEGSEADCEITEFMEQLFPCDELRDYMWQHLGSVLIGTNDNQTFNIYTGSGRNGKSKIVELMGKTLGDYKGTVPITLITQKRTSIGGTSSEIVQLVGVRYAVMQEPSKGDEINEGIMKEITGGDPIQGRALFKDTVTFIPQFKLVVCTNTLFDIKSNDDGTWRRIRVCDFASKFLDSPYEDPKFPESEFPHQYKLNKRLDDKFEKWAPALASRLVDIAFRTGGNVADAQVVMASSDKYRRGQDYLECFASSCIESRPGERIRKTELYEHFRCWYITHCGKGTPKATEVYEYMDRKFGAYCRRGGQPGWHDVKLVYDEDEGEDSEEE